MSRIYPQPSQSVPQKHSFRQVQLRELVLSSLPFVWQGLSLHPVSVKGVQRCFPGKYLGFKDSPAIYPKNLETPVQKIYMHYYVLAALFTTAKIWKEPKCPSVDECIKKLWYIYTVEYYLAM